MNPPPDNPRRRTQWLSLPAMLTEPVFSMSENRACKTEVHNQTLIGTF